MLDRFGPAPDNGAHIREGMRAYLDYNATAPLRPEARTAMMRALDTLGNPSSVHAEGRAARALVERARTQVAALVGASPRQVTFTSGGTEANATVLTPAWSRNGVPLKLRHLVVSAVEHPSVLSGGRFPQDRVHQAPVDGDGVVDLAALATVLDRLDGPALVSVMGANNETGVIQPVAGVVACVHPRGGIVHSDAVQVAGRVPVDIGALGVDVLTLSSHKLGGPQGAGAIVRRGGAAEFAPLVTGGGQETRVRAGTENVAAIAGFGAAAASSIHDTAEEKRLRSLSADLERIVGNEAVIFGRGVPRLPQTVCFGLAGMSAETAVIALDLAGVAVSSGAACSSGKVGPSHVLTAMGVGDDVSRSAIRLSLGWDSAEEHLDSFSKVWADVLERAR